MISNDASCAIPGNGWFGGGGSRDYRDWVGYGGLRRRGGVLATFSISMTLSLFRRLIE